jgi:hypothetical protein
MKDAVLEKEEQEKAEAERKGYVCALCEEPLDREDWGDESMCAHCRNLVAQD